MIDPRGGSRVSPTRTPTNPRTEQRLSGQSSNRHEPKRNPPESSPPSVSSLQEIASSRNDINAYFPQVWQHQTKPSPKGIVKGSNRKSGPRDARVTVTVFFHTDPNRIAKELSSLSKQSFGHAIAEVNGQTYSWNGELASTSDHDAAIAQNLAEGWVGYSFDLAVTQEEADALEEKFHALAPVKTGVSHAEAQMAEEFGLEEYVGPEEIMPMRYGLFTNNCGDAVESWLDDLGYETGPIVTPEGLGLFLFETDLVTSVEYHDPNEANRSPKEP